LIFLPNTGLNNAGFVAEKIRKEVEDAVIVTKEEDSDIFVNLKVTISIGAAELRQIDGFKDKPAKDLLLELVGRADKALYESKTSGRNMVTLSE